MALLLITMMVFYDDHGNFVCSGLSDEMRADFHLMKDLATHTRIGPQERNDSLTKFMSDMKRYLKLEFAPTCLAQIHSKLNNNRVTSDTKLELAL